MTRLTGLQALFASPDLYPLAADIPGRRLLFARLGAAAARDLAFHDPRTIRPAADGFTVDAGPLLRDAPDRSRVRRTIFHIAFCASTLLSRALDRLPGVHGWREPYLLLQVAEASGRTLPDAAAERAWTVLALALLERGGALGRVVVKAHDRMLPRAADLLAGFPEMRAVALSIDLDGFVLGCVKSEARRAWTAQGVDLALGQLRAADEASPLAGLRPEGAAAQAALLWLHRIGLIAAARRRLGPARLPVFDGGRLVAERRTMLPEIAQALDLAAPDLAPEPALFDDPVWSRHAKAPEAAMDAEAHAARRRSLAAAHAPALAAARAAVEAWLPGLPDLSREVHRTGGLVVYAPVV